MFIGEKPSDYFLKHPEKRNLGNFNTTCIDFCFQRQIKEFGLGQIYITDLVKTENKAGADFEKEWKENPKFKECLLDEIRIVEPKFIVCISSKADRLFRREFKGQVQARILEKIYHPAYVFRWGENGEWNVQFQNLLGELK